MKDEKETVLMKRYIIFNEMGDRVCSIISDYVDELPDGAHFMIYKGDKGSKSLKDECVSYFSKKFSFVDTDNMSN